MRKLRKAAVMLVGCCEVSLSGVTSSGAVAHKDSVSLQLQTVVDQSVFLLPMICLMFSAYWQLLFLPRPQLSLVTLLVCPGRFPAAHPLPGDAVGQSILYQPELPRPVALSVPLA